MVAITTRRDLERAHALLEILDRIVDCRKRLANLDRTDREHKIALIKVGGPTGTTAPGFGPELKGYRIDINTVDIVEAYLTKLKIVEEDTRSDLKEYGVIING